MLIFLPMNILEEAEPKVSSRFIIINSKIDLMHGFIYQVPHSRHSTPGSTPDEIRSSRILARLMIGKRSNLCRVGRDSLGQTGGIWKLYGKILFASLISLGSKLY